MPETPADARRIFIVGRDLLTTSRIAAAAETAGYGASRIDDPAGLPPPTAAAIVFVDWSDRQAGWADALRSWMGRAGEAAPRVIVFGPHTDLVAHREARDGGLGPMMARSRLFATLPSLLHP